MESKLTPGSTLLPWFQLLLSRFLLPFPEVLVCNQLIFGPDYLNLGFFLHILGQSVASMRSQVRLLLRKVLELLL